MRSSPLSRGMRQGRPGARGAAFRARMVLALTFLLLPVAAAAQSAATIPLWDPVYRDLDRLVGAGLVTEVFVGQRPYSERRFGDFLVEASVRAGEDGRAIPPALREALERLRARFSDDAGGGGFELSDVRADLTAAESLTRDTHFDTGRGWIDDRVNPLLAYRHGRAVGHGVTGGLEASLRGTLDRRLAVEVRPRLQGRHLFHLGRDEGADALPAENRVAGDPDLHVMRMYGRAVLANAAVLLGRDAVVWGQGARAGLLLSTNARGLDMVHVSNEEPVTLPWVLGWIGPSRFSFFGADLGSGQSFPHAKLFGAKWSARPHGRLELGVSYVNKQGGEGAPEASLRERILDVLFFPDVFDDDAEFVFSEKIISGDMRWRLPTAAPAEFYAEAAFTDFDLARFDQTLTLEAAYVAGLFFPALGASGRNRLRLEGQHTGATFYRHAQFHSGFTLDRQVIGTALGPDGESAMIELGRVTSGGDEWSLELAAELRERDSYVVIEGNEDLRARKVKEWPDEWRYRGRVGWLGRFGAPGSRAGSAFEVTAGVERVDGFGFRAGDERTFGFVGVVGTWWPR